jgi:hypothetical protein
MLSLRRSLPSLVSKALILPCRERLLQYNNRSFSSSGENPTSATNNKEWEVVIGLEIHAQITANTKLFSGGATNFEEEPNSKVSLHDAAIPGTLPALNRWCVGQSVKTALALEGNVSVSSNFDRKHYFYCDLPTGYQITQQFRPIMTEGKLRLQSGREVRISALKLEQDSGKSLHDQHPFLTYLDLNRAGSALMEIVSEPDLRLVLLVLHSRSHSYSPQSQSQHIPQHSSLMLLTALFLGRVQKQGSTLESYNIF